MRVPKKPPDLNSILDRLEPGDLRSLLGKGELTASDGRYLHWDELRYRTPPDGLSTEHWWAATKLSRRETPISEMRSAFGASFGYVDLPTIRESLHRFDRANVGETVVRALGTSDAPVEYRVRQLIEEAISSSLIEGARPSTREVARNMVREGRSPATKDERMIVNNWRAMERVVELVRAREPMSLSSFLELHRLIGDDALEVDGADGQLRQPHHRVEVADHQGNVWHVPPSAVGLSERLEKLFEFVNRNDGPFLHPVLRSIVAHFWVGFEHPFRDGNGRMARALFYWCMLSHGYEMAEFLSISGPIDRKPTDYYRAFSYTETDEYDLTYFILHQLRVMHEAMDELVDHLTRRAEQTKKLASVVSDFGTLNHRQRSLLNYAIRHTSQSLTIEAHQKSHRVHYMTARSDLLDLVARGLLRDRGGKPKRFLLAREFLTSSTTKKRDSEQ